MTRLFLIRHGETLWHAEGRYAGSADVGMTERGHEQAQRLAAWAADADLSAVYSSPSSRARDTARPAATAAGLDAQVDTRFAEVDFAAGEGLTREEMAERFPEALDAFLAHPALSPLPGGEQGLRALDRFLAGLDEVVKSFSGDSRVVIVSHSTVIRLALCRLLGIDPDTYRQVFPEMLNTALIEVEYDGSRPAALLRFNEPLE